LYILPDIKYVVIQLLQKSTLVSAVSLAA